MRILIELPTWIGDYVMSTPAIENLLEYYPNDEIIFFGSSASIALMTPHPRAKHTFVDESKKANVRLFWYYKLAKKLPKIDLAISFRRSTATKLFFFFLGARQRFLYTKFTQQTEHQVIYYNTFINHITQQHATPKQTKLYFEKQVYKRKTLGLNPGATYGSAKRWYPEYFAQVALHYSHEYDIVIFGGPSEVAEAKIIEDILRNEGVTNLENIAGKTTIASLVSRIAGLDLFITNDSGPMHIASAYDVPTVAVFGPTSDIETSAWMMSKYKIAKITIECAPCFKRECPVGHHACMKNLSPETVIEKIKILGV